MLQESTGELRAIGSSRVADFRAGQDDFLDDDPVESYGEEIRAECDLSEAVHSRFYHGCGVVRSHLTPLVAHNGQV